MSLSQFIPAIWSGRLLVNLRKSLVATQAGVVNRDYEGEIQGAGSSVKIHAIGAVAIRDYTKDTDITGPDALTDAELVLLIDQQKYFNFSVDDIDRVQQKPKVMDGAMAEAAYAIRDTVDQFMLAKYVDVPAANSIGSDGSPLSITAALAYTTMVDLGTKLTDAKVPLEGRWVIVPPWFHAYLLKSDLFVHATALGDSVLRNGQVGRVAGFDVLLSHNVPNTSATKYKILAGHAMAWSFAEQISEVEGFRPEKRFGDAVKGLFVYGGKVVRPSALALATSNTS